MSENIYRYRFIKTDVFKDELTEKCHRENGYNFDYTYYCIDADGNKIDFPKHRHFTFNRWYILKKLQPMNVGEYFEEDVNVD